MNDQLLDTSSELDNDHLEEMEHESEDDVEWEEHEEIVDNAESDDENYMSSRNFVK